jgi:hypothetical protein
MISPETVHQEIWPVVERLIQATVAEDDVAVKRLLLPNGQAAEMHDLFGHVVFDILLKTVLGRERSGLTRAIETERGRTVYVEYVWPDPEAAGGSYTAADVVSVKLGRRRRQWRVVEVNPASVELPLTGPRAQGILVTTRAIAEEGRVPQEPWILPVALFGGALQIPLRPAALGDPVEALFLPGLQHRAYGVISLLAARRLWREFSRKARPELERPAAWAAAVEFLVGEQMMRDVTQAAVARYYEVGLADILPRIRRIKETLAITGIDDRYTELRPTQIVFKDSSGEAQNGESGQAPVGESGS